MKKNLSFKGLTKENLKEIPLLLDFLPIKFKGDLRKIIEERLRELESLKLLRGIRRRKGYPVRGQRTRTNARTARKKRN